MGSTSSFESYQSGLLGAEAFGHSTAPRPAEGSTLQDKARQCVFEYIKPKLEKTDDHVTFNEEDVYIVIFSYILGNWKALVSTTLPDGMYYEVTYNKAKRETYIDAYKKFDNVCITDDSEIG